MGCTVGVMTASSGATASFVGYTVGVMTESPVHVIGHALFNTEAFISVRDIILSPSESLSVHAEWCFSTVLELKLRIRLKLEDFVYPLCRILTPG